MKPDMVCSPLFVCLFVCFSYEVCLFVFHMICTEILSFSPLCNIYTDHNNTFSYKTYSVLTVHFISPIFNKRLMQMLKKIILFSLENCRPIFSNSDFHLCALFG